MAGGDSSDDEMYKGACKMQTMFPWLQSEFEVVHD